MVRKLFADIPMLASIDYITIWIGCIILDIKLSDTIAESDKPVVIAVDSSGIRVTNRDE